MFYGKISLLSLAYIRRVSFFRMKIGVYSGRKDERDFFDRAASRCGVQLVACGAVPDLSNYRAAEGCRALSVITTPISAKLLDAFYSVGVRYISTRTVGYDHIDVAHAREIGMHIGNVSYSPDSVADYAVMMILIAVRKLKAIVIRAQGQDFSLGGVRGRELRDLTVGVIGTGRIGSCVVRRLAGFGCRVLACDLHENDQVRLAAEYVPLEELYRHSDVITLHMPATAENYHMIGRESISRMKRGVCIVNTARGSLIDSQALIEALEDGRVGSAALDVVEDEAGLYYNGLKCINLKNRELAILRSFPNTFVTPHTAFYTEHAVRDMVEYSVESCAAFCRGEDNPWLVI